MFILCSDVTKGLKLSVVVEQVIPSYALVDGALFLFTKKCLNVLVPNLSSKLAFEGNSKY